MHVYDSIYYFTSWHPNMQKITTYLDANGTSKNHFFLCEQLIQAKTPDRTHIILYVRGKLFSIQRKIGDFHKDYYIQQI